jgi:hypothetical protein
MESVRTSELLENLFQSTQSTEQKTNVFNFMNAETNLEKWFVIYNVVCFVPVTMKVASLQREMRFLLLGLFEIPSSKKRTKNVCIVLLNKNIFYCASFK